MKNPEIFLNVLKDLRHIEFMEILVCAKISNLMEILKSVCIKLSRAQSS